MKPVISKGKLFKCLSGYQDTQNCGVNRLRRMEINVAIPDTMDARLVDFMVLEELDMAKMHPIIDMGK